MGGKGGAWRRAHGSDAFFHEARRRGLRSRAALKLEAIDARDHLLRDARVVVDLGAAPGGWSQIARRAIASDGRIVALDIVEMEPLAGVEFIHGDFLRAEVLARVETSVGRRAADLVMSDMAPNLSGVRVNDQARWRALAESAAGFADAVLRSDGAFLVKLFQGEEATSYLRTLHERFASVVVRKPTASRKHSSELYALARGLKPRDRKRGPRARTRSPDATGSPRGNADGASRRPAAEGWAGGSAATPGARPLARREPGEKRVERTGPASMRRVRTESWGIVSYRLDARGRRGRPSG